MYDLSCVTLNGGIIFFVIPDLNGQILNSVCYWILILCFGNTQVISNFTAEPMKQFSC